MSHRVIQSFLLGSVLLMVATPAMSADAPKPKAKPPAAGDIKETDVFQYGKFEERDTLYLSAHGGGTTVKQHNLRIVVKDVSSGDVKEVVAVEGKDGHIAQTLGKMKSGEYLSMTIEKQYNHTYVRTLTAYPLRPGEDRPGVFVFVETATQKKDTGDAVQVKVYKLGQFGALTVPSVKGEGGKMVPDPQMTEVIGKLSKGDTVEVTAASGGAAPTIKTIEPYAVPQNGVVSKVTDADVQGGKTPAIEVNIDGSAKTLLAPGKLDGRGAWVPDSALAAAVKRFKEGDKVVVRFRTDDGKCWLKEIAKAPEPAK